MNIMRVLFSLALPMVSGSTTFNSRSELVTAVTAYISNDTDAVYMYGPIANWNVSKITDMHVRRRSTWRAFNCRPATRVREPWVGQGADGSTARNGVSKGSGRLRPPARSPH